MDGWRFSWMPVLVDEGSHGWRFSRIEAWMGFRILGQIPSTVLFRQLRELEPLSATKDLFGQTAIDFVDSFITKRRT